MQGDQNKIFDDIINNNSNLLALLIGTNQTGKSTYLQGITQENKSKDIIYITPYINEVIKEKNILFINPNDFFILDFDLISNSLIIFDDCKTYISTNLLEHNTKQLNNLIIQRRYLNIELYFSFHSFTQIPSFLLDYCNKMIIKKTSDNLNKIKSRLLHFDLIIDTQNEVNTHKNEYYFKELSF